MLEGATRVEVDRRPALPIALASRDDMDSWRPRYHMPTVASSNKMASLDSLDEFVSFVTGNLMGFNIGAIGL